MTDYEALMARHDHALEVLARCRPPKPPPPASLPSSWRIAARGAGRTAHIFLPDPLHKRRLRSACGVLGLVSPRQVAAAPDTARRCRSCLPRKTPRTDAA